MYTYWPKKKCKFLDNPKSLLKSLQNIVPDTKNLHPGICDHFFFSATWKLPLFGAISDIVGKVLKPVAGRYFRPELSGLEGALEGGSSMATALKDIITSCWSEEPNDRPNTAHALKSLARINPNK